MINIQHTNTCSGIYLIVNVISKKTYIGSSKSIYYRIARHISDLKKNRHANNHLQNSWNKHGENAFICKIIEKCPLEILTQREQYYIDIFKPTLNLTINVIRNVLSKESTMKISNTLKRKYKSGEIKTYRQNHAWRKAYQYNSKLELVGTYDNLVLASKSVGLTRNAVQNVIDKKNKTCAGYIWKSAPIKSDELLGKP